MCALAKGLESHYKIAGLTPIRGNEQKLERYLYRKPGMECLRDLRAFESKHEFTHAYFVSAFENASSGDSFAVNVSSPI